MKRFGILLLMLALSSLACETLLGTADQATNQPPADQSPVQPPVLQIPNLSGVTLGDVVRDEGCGYTFRKIPGYTLSGTPGWGYTMTAPGAKSDTGPAIDIFCVGSISTARTNDDVIKMLEADNSSTPEANPIIYSNQRNVTIGGVNAVSLDSTATTPDGIAVKGQAILAMVTPYREFAIVAEAPSDKWDETHPYFEAVVNSVTFFEPTTTPTTNP
jgi:hypothetical protein